MILTKEHIAALKAADDIAFFHRDGASYLRAIKRAKAPTDKDLYGRPEASVEIGCGHQFRVYDRDGHMYEPSDWACFEMLHCARATEEWQTVLTLLKPGYSLFLRWQRGAWTTTGLDRTGFVGDFLTVCIERGESKPLFFQIGHYIGPADSTARMVRHAGRTLSIAAA